MKNIIKLPGRAVESESSEFNFDIQADSNDNAVGSDAGATSGNDMLLLVRLSGIVLLSIGLLAGLKIMLDGFQLYREPARIEVFAQAIEKGSNIDRTLAPDNGDELRNDGNFRMSYFAAWAIVLTLLLFISMIAFTAIRTGGELLKSAGNRN